MNSMISKATYVAAVLLLVTACQGQAMPEADRTVPADELFERISAHCGRAFPGLIIVNESATDEDPCVGQALLMHVRECANGTTTPHRRLGATNSDRIDDCTA